MERGIAVADDGAFADGDQPRQPRSREHPCLELGGRWRSLLEGDRGLQHVGPVDVGDGGSVGGRRRPNGHRASHGEIL